MGRPTSKSDNPEGPGRWTSNSIDSMFAFCVDERLSVEPREAVDELGGDLLASEPAEVAIKG